MPEYPLNEGESATVAANGTARVSLSPSGTTEMWIITTATVVVEPFPSGSDPVPVAKLFLNSVAATNYIAGSETGYNDSATGGTIQLMHGQPLVATWEDASPGAVATLSIFGTRIVS